MFTASASQRADLSRFHVHTLVPIKFSNGNGHLLWNNLLFAVSCNGIPRFSGREREGGCDKAKRSSAHVRLRSYVIDDGLHARDRSNRCERWSSGSGGTREWTKRRHDDSSICEYCPKDTWEHTTRNACVCRESNVEAADGCLDASYRPGREGNREEVFGVAVPQEQVAPGRV